MVSRAINNHERRACACVPARVRYSMMNCRIIPIPKHGCLYQVYHIYQHIVTYIPARVRLIGCTGCTNYGADVPELILFYQWEFTWLRNDKNKFASIDGDFQLFFTKS